MSSDKVLSIGVQFGVAAEHLAESLRSASASLGAGLSEEADLCLGFAGLTGSANVDVTVTGSHGRIRVFVNGNECDYPDTLPSTCVRMVRQPVKADDGLESGDAATYVTLFLQREALSPEFTTVTRAFIRRVLELKPSVLLGPEQAAAFRSSLVAAGMSAEDANRPDVQRAASILLDRGMSLANALSTAPYLMSLLSGEASIDQIIVDIEQETFEKKVDVLLARPMLRRLSLHGMPGAVFQEERVAFAQATGLQLPEIKFVESPTIRDNSFAFRFQGWTTPVYAGLQPDEVLLENGSASGIASRGVVIPETSTEYRLVSEYEAMFDRRYDEFGYVALCLSAAFRARAAKNLSTLAVRSLIESAGWELAERVQKAPGLSQVGRILSLLIDESVSIRNMRRILERILEFDYVPHHSADGVLFDDRMPVREERIEMETGPDPGLIAEFVRMGLRDQITHELTRGSRELFVYALHPEIETLIERCEATTSRRDTREKILAVVGAALHSATWPILSSVEARRAIHNLIRHRFRSANVVSPQEILPQTVVQVVRQIDAP